MIERLRRFFFGRHELEERIDELRSGDVLSSDEVADAVGASENHRPDVIPVLYDFDDVWEALEEQVPNWDEVDMWYPMYRLYYVPSYRDWDAIVDYDGTSEKDYERERFDCVSFTRVFAGNIPRKYRLNNVGTVISYEPPVHKFNVVLVHDDDGALHVEFFSPQRGRFVTHAVKDDHPMWTTRGAVLSV